MKIKLLLIILLTYVLGFSQSDRLTINNLNILVQPNGDIHADSFVNNPGASFDTIANFSEMPIGSNLRTIYKETIWIGGYDQNGFLRVAANTLSPKADFAPGPVASSYSNTYEDTYNRVWKITKSEIENHQLNYNTVGYNMPAIIADWPANGNILNGEAQNLAPYADLNSNNIYEPELGEYPLIRGDQAIFVMYNDVKNFHENTGGLKTHTEIHLMLYAYQSNTFNNNVYYMHYELINRSQDISYHNFYISNFNDFDIGYAYDDYFGTHVGENLIYAYNADSVDELGFENHPPVYGTKLLNKDITHSITYKNYQGGINGTPNDENHFYNYMNGKLLNGQSIINEIDSSISNFIYPGESDTINQANWSQVNAQNIAEDYRMLSSTIHQAYEPGDVICLDYAGIFALDTMVSGYEQINTMFSMSNLVQDFYDSQYTDCSDVSDLALLEISSESDNLLIEMNLLNDELTLTSKEILKQDVEIIITDILGRTLQKTTFIAGENSMSLNLSNTNTKIMLVSLHFDDHIVSRKLIR